MRGLLRFVVMVLVGSNLQAETAHDWFKKGNAKLAAGEWEEAAADFTKAIALRPEYPEAYANRGYAKRLRGETDAAIADYDKAIEQNARLAPPYNHRGVALMLKGETDRALADFSKALELDPKYAEASLNRFFANFSRGDWKAAEADLRAGFLINRGDPDFPRLYLWMTQARAGNKAAGDRELEEYLGRKRVMPGGDWARSIGAFLLGRTSEKDFLAAITAPDEETQKGRLCEAWFFAGEKRLVAGDVGGAKECFRQCLETKRADFAEYQLAAAALKAMN